VDVRRPLGSGVEGVWGSVGDLGGLISEWLGDDGSHHSLDLLLSQVGEWVLGDFHWSPVGGERLDLVNNLLVDWVFS